MAHLFGRDWKRTELLAHLSNMDAVAGIKLVEGADGKERGVRMLEVWTGSGFQFRVLADRTLDISACSYKGTPLGWVSSVGDVHPSYYEPEEKGFLRSFPGGLLATCGLDTFGVPSKDQDEVLGQHGRVGNLPAQSISYSSRWEGEDYLLEIRGLVRQTRVFGENLVLRRRLITALGSNRIRIEDIVTNEGGEPWPHMILYHFNFGFPLISAAASLHIDAEQTIPLADIAAQHIDTWNQFSQPASGIQEMVYHHTPKADSDGRVHASIENPQLGLRFHLSFDRSALPHLYQWKMMGQGMYVLGLEPANSSGITGRALARQRNDVDILQPGDSHAYNLELSVEEIT